MCSNFDLSDRVARIRSVWKEQDVCQFQRERVTILLQGISLLLEHMKWLTLQNRGDARQFSRCEDIIKTHKKELGEILALLNSSDDEYIQPGKIMN